MTKKLIGKGSEHNIYSLSDDPLRLFKTPRFLTRLEMRLLGLNYEDIQHELDQAFNIIKETNVQIPETKISSEPKIIYTIIQEKVKNDHSIPSIKDYLISQNLPFMVDEFEIDSTNLISHKGKVYWIDPFRGLAGRLIGHFSFPLFLKMRRLHAAYKRKYHRFKGVA